jgi:hypothetical protein
MTVRHFTLDDWRRMAERLPAPPDDAWSEGTRVRKNGYSDGGLDTHAEGALATVRLALPYVDGIGLGYVVEWDDIPGIPALVVALKLELVQ